MLDASDRETVAGAVTMLRREARRFIMHPDMADAIDLACALLEPLTVADEIEREDDAQGFGRLTASGDPEWEWREEIDRLFMRAEYETNGVMRSPAGVRAGYPSKRFFTDRRPRAAYASPELLEWLRVNGPIPTLAQYRSGEGVARDGRNHWYERETTESERKSGRLRTGAQKARDRRALAAR